MNSFLLLFILEVVAGINAVMVFRFLERPIAGLIAGSVFCLVGLCSVWIFYKQALRFRWLNMAVVLVYLVGFSLPLLIARASSPLNRPIDTVFDIPLEAFHRGSEIMFLMLVLTTILQWWFTYKANTTGKPQ